MPSDPIVALDATRNGFVESHHRGTLVLLDADGTVAVAAGDPYRPVLPRSSLKPLQAITMVECGFPGRDGSLALAAASHDGEDVHVAGARSILAAAGLDESALQCPPDLPSGREAMLAHVAAGRDHCGSATTARASTPRCWPPAWPTAGTSRPTATPGIRCKRRSARGSRPRAASRSWPAASTAAAHRPTRSASSGWRGRSPRWRALRTGRRPRWFVTRCGRTPA